MEKIYRLEFEFYNVNMKKYVTCIVVAETIIQLEKAVMTELDINMDENLGYTKEQKWDFLKKDIVHKKLELPIVSMVEW